MFNRRMVYMAAPGDVPQQNVEGESGAAGAKAKLKDMFPPEPAKLDAKKGPEVSYQGNSLDQEKVRTDEAARADIIAAAKFGKPLGATVPGLDAATLKTVKENLKKVPEDHFATQRMEVTVDDKTLYFVSIYDSTKKAPSMFYTTDPLDPNSRSFLRDVDDPTYKKLTGKDREKKAA